MRAGVRMLVAVCTSVVLAFAIIVFVMRVFNPPQRIEDAVYDNLTEQVKTIDLDADPALKQALRDSLAGRKTEPAPTSNKPARFVLPPREVKGFVQIEVQLDSTGQVAGAKVVGAMPPGVYDRQALDQVRAQRYAPILKDGKPVAGKVTQVVPFSVPADGQR